MLWLEADSHDTTESRAVDVDLYLTLRICLQRLRTAATHSTWNLFTRRHGASTSILRTHPRHTTVLSVWQTWVRSLQSLTDSPRRYIHASAPAVLWTFKSWGLRCNCLSICRPEYIPAAYIYCTDHCTVRYYEEPILWISRRMADLLGKAQEYVPVLSWSMRLIMSPTGYRRVCD